MISLCFMADDAAATPAFSLPSKMPIHFHLRATEFDLPRLLPFSEMFPAVPSRVATPFTPKDDTPFSLHHGPEQAPGVILFVHLRPT